MDPVLAFDPWPRVKVAAAPLVQVTVNVAVPFKAVEALVITGSYVPKARLPAEIVQLALTVAVTLILLVAVPANMFDEAIAKNMNVAKISWIFLVIKLLVLRLLYSVHRQTFPADTGIIGGPKRGFNF